MDALEPESKYVTRTRPAQKEKIDEACVPYYSSQETDSEEYESDSNAEYVSSFHLFTGSSSKRLIANRVNRWWKDPRTQQLHPNGCKAMSNWERKSSHLLREIVKFRTYIDFLRSRWFSVKAQVDICASTFAKSWNRDAIRCLNETYLTAGPYLPRRALVSGSHELMRCFLQGNTADDTSFRGIHLELRRVFELVKEAKLNECLEEYVFPATEEKIWGKSSAKPPQILLGVEVSLKARVGGEEVLDKQHQYTIYHYGTFYLSYLTLIGVDLIMYIRSLISMDSSSSDHAHSFLHLTDPTGSNIYKPDLH